MPYDRQLTQQTITEAARAAANDWFRRQAATLTTPMFLFYKPGQIAFWIGEKPLNDAWQKADETPVSIALSVPQIVRKIVDQAQRLPILGDAE